MFKTWLRWICHDSVLSSLWVLLEVYITVSEAIRVKQDGFSVDPYFGSLVCPREAHLSILNE